jgi:hypothetical protein
MRIRDCANQHAVSLVVSLAQTIKVFCTLLLAANNLLVQTFSIAKKREAIKNLKGTKVFEVSHFVNERN